ncbi:hypothetical protein PPL_09761 [Heterostelium album PN500]|uniref:Carrier domain-containing protein n=1 Tax=Heterostelium pallidum (strain ATCC 26659 / Pp 5 / PN500) TaxID=670386 RepID=D3BNZ9_HETP5|nr:hypothetical protein PPL_09761 [Heterostelium album PN500]EFA77009.1 hypothetical protein PPL_09761 [Heterostelium album PN500]|eukprot:XP_020429139.1 hypothetical protein PPL_09761 [Heterostelium album PN500]
MINNFDRNCKVCSKIIVSGQERYVCSECTDLTICLECYPHSNTLSDIHTDSAPLPHYCTIEKYTNEEIISLTEDPDFSTTILNVFKTLQNRRCLGHWINNRDLSLDPTVEWLTYQQVYERALMFGTTLLETIPIESKVGIYLTNVPEWYIVDLACLWYGFIIVPYNYQTNLENLYSILNNSETSAIIVDRISFQNLSYLLETNEDIKKQLKLIVHLEDTFNQDLRNKLPSNISFKLFSQMLLVEETIQPKKTNCKIKSLGYSSGSTGIPKGVVFINNTLKTYVNEQTDYSTLITLSFSSLAHAQRSFDYGRFRFGGRVALYSGKMEHIFDYIKMTRPHLIFSVPVFWKFVYSNFESILKSYISDHPHLSIEQCTKDVKKLHNNIFGDRIVHLYSIGAPLNLSVSNLINGIIGKLTITNYYGTTETQSIAFNGKVVPHLEYRLESVPELGFTINDTPYPRGEMIVNTSNISGGYYNNKEANTAFKDGWYYTGDIVEEYGTRSIRIIDRKKNAFKLSNGEFVCCEIIESLYSNSPLIKNIFVFGNINQSYLVAIVVPSQNALDKIDLIDFIKYQDNNQLKRLILEEIDRISKLNKSPHYEIPKMISLDNTQWTIENELLTPTGKFSRPNLYKYYKDDIESMFQTLNSIQEGLSSESEDKTNLLFNYLKFVLGLDINTLSEVDLSKLSFSQIGGDSIGAVKLSTLLKDKAKIDVKPQQILDKNVNLIDIFKNIIKNNEINWEDEMKLDDSIQTNGKSMKSSGFNNIFLTGATGFNGSFLLYDLIRNQNISKVFCLIRSSGSQSDARSKLVDIIRLKNNMMIKENEISKIHPIIGDLELPLFGLNINEFIDLSNQTDLIIHNGAYVHLMNPYSNMKMANVKGTEEVLRLSTIGDHIIPVSHISSIGTLHQFNQEIDDTIEPDLKNLNGMSGYSQSKLIAEQLIHIAFQRGLPIIMFRPGVIYSHTETGVDNSNDYIRLVLSGILYLGYYPDLSEEKINLLNLGPVDWISSSIINISLNRSWNDADDNNDKTPTFLLTNQKSITFNDFCLSISKIHPLKMTSFDNWKDLLLEQKNNPLHTMFKAFNQIIPTLSQYPIDNTNTTKEILKCGGYACPEINFDIIQKNIKHISKSEQLYITNFKTNK